MFPYSSYWYILLGAFLLGWLAIVVIRRKQFDRREVKRQLLTGVFGTIALASMEVFAVSTNLWNYTPGNWPVILWPTYFAAILFGYQLLRVVEKIV